MSQLMNDSLKQLILYELANYDKKEEFLRSIKKLYIFDNVNHRSPFNINGKNFFIIDENDDVFVFGQNGLGCLGVKICAPVSVPKQIPVLSGIGVLSFSNGLHHVIARNKDNKIYCWGYNNYGQLGNGKYESVSEVAQQNEKLKKENIIDVCCGDWHSMALTSSGQLFAWGDNKYGQIGHNKDEICNPIPVRLSGFNDEKIKSIACGSMHSMALTEEGNVYSWGYNKYGQLGIGNTKNQNCPIRIKIETQMIETIEKISCGQKHSFILANNGNIFTFGKNYLKTVGSNRDQKTPILINEERYKDIVSNNFYPFSVAINQRNEVYEIGQVGSEKLRSLINTNTKDKPINDAEDYYLKNKLITIRVKDFFDRNIHFQNNNNDQPGVFNNTNQPEIRTEQVTNSSEGEPSGSDSNVYLPDCSDGQQVIADAIIHSPDRRDELITTDDNNQQNSNNQNLNNSSNFNQNDAPQEVMQPHQVSNADEQNDNLNIDSTVLNINGNNNIRREVLENVEVLTVVTGTNNINLNSGIGNLANNLPSTSNFDLILNRENIISNENENIDGNARAINSTTPQNNMNENIVPSDVEETIEKSRKSLDTQFSYNGMYKHKFEEIAKLKEGGFGVVFKVKSREDKQIYAVKKILSQDKKQLKSSTKEFEIMSRLTSDHVVRYFTAWIEENPTICYIQMELCFCSLRDILEQEYNEFYKMENEMINHIEYYFKSELFKEILQGVNYLHTLEKPIIHRDLKPNNILIKDSFDERQRFIKIADFGLSNFESNLNSKSFVEGCFKYMAPEILKNKKFSYETSADIYSLGQIAQEMFDIDVTESLSAKEIKYSIVSEKFIVLWRTLVKMIDDKIRLRPNCDRILENIGQWGITYQEMKNDTTFSNFIGSINLNEPMKLDSFHKYYLGKKVTQRKS